MKAYIYALGAIVVTLPNPTFAATSSIQNVFTNILVLANDTIVPFLFGLAFLLFIINAVKYFVIQGNNEDGREKAKSLAIYSVSAFVFLITFWGIINMFVDSFGIGPDVCTQPITDYYSGATPPPCTP
jgi:hypothetical protein